MSIQKTINDWREYFVSHGLNENLVGRYINYIAVLLSNDVPIIFGFNHLCLLYGREPLYLASVINSPDNHYREFKIKKKSGGERIITVPYPALLEIQYWIYHNILKRKVIHHSAHGFTYKKSIITNSKIHAGQNHLLKIDIKDYFPSISLGRIICVFKSFGYPNKISFYLASICSYNRALPQGAPTSPILSNLVSKRMDEELMCLASTFNLKYTRYADDIAISGDIISDDVVEYAVNIVRKNGFTVNKTKTKLYKKKTRRIITGISVLEKEIALPREYKRRLRQEIYYIQKYGLMSHLAKKKIRRIDYLRSVIGKVNFWLSVEPKNEYAINAKSILCEYLKKENL